MRASNRTRHNCFLGFPAEWIDIPSIILVIKGGDRKDAFADPKVAQLWQGWDQFVDPNIGSPVLLPVVLSHPTTYSPPSHVAEVVVNNEVGEG